MHNGKIRVLQIGNILSLIALVVVNFLSTSLPINNVTMADVTYAYPHLLIPSGFTFSIWGIIYLMLAGFCIHLAAGVNTHTVAAIPKTADQRRNVGTHGALLAAGNVVSWVKKISVLFIITCILNIGWIFSWHYYQLGLCLLIILTYFIVVFMIYRQVAPNHILSSKERWLISIPFSIYVGWLTIASLENFSSWLVAADMPGLGIEPTIWAAINIVFGTLCAVFFRFRFNDRVYPLVIAWALFGIAYNQYELNAINTVVVFSGLGMLASIILSLIPGKKQTTHHHLAKAA